MYLIYVDNELIYSPTLYRSNYDVFSSTLTQELNKADTLTFQAPSTNPNYAHLTRYATVEVYDDETRMFRGRILYDDTDFYKNKSVYAEGELGFLNDVVLRPYSYSGNNQDPEPATYLRHLIHLYNQGVEASKRYGKYVNGNAETDLTFGNCDITDPNNYIVRANSDYVSVLDEINDKLIGLLGGYLIPRMEIENGQAVNYLDYKQASGVEGSQKIRFAENLLDLTTNQNADELFTVIVPVGKKDDATGERLTIEHAHDPNDASQEWGQDFIEDSAASAVYGRIERVVAWDDVTVPDNLFAKAQKALSEACEIKSVTLNALDMHDLGVDIAALKLGNWYRLISAPHGYTDETDNLFQLVRITRQLQNPDKSTFTFGRVWRTISRELSKT